VIGTMDLPVDMLYEISRHADAKTMFNMCLADKSVWERQKKSLYDREYRRFVTELAKEINHYKSVNKIRQRPRLGNIKRIHQMIRILLKFKHIIKNIDSDYRDMISARFVHWGEVGMCKKKIKTYKEALDLF